jgi:hypothetical protein
MKARAKNLDHESVAAIVEILVTWTGELRWCLLVDAVRDHCGETYTRQALSRHEGIAAAFRQRKSTTILARPSRGRPRTAADQLDVNAVARMTAEIARLRAENAALMEQFARWAYNAHCRGLDEAYLNRPLPHVERGQPRSGRNRRTS